MSDSPTTAMELSRPGLLQQAGRYLGLQTIPLPELRARYANEHSRFMEVDGTHIHYRVEGQGPPLVLLHGVMAQLQTWDGWISELARHYRVVRVDVPGFGLTGPMVRGSYTPEYSLELISRMLAHLDLGETISIAGNSLGGFLAWYYAVNHPQKVERLVLIDPLSYPQKPPAIMRVATTPPIRWIAPHCVPRSFIADSLNAVYGDASRIKPGTLQRYHDLLLREGNRQAMIDYFSAAGRFLEVEADGKGRYARRIPEIACPTLVMWGEADAWLSVGHVESFRRDVPHAEIKVYPGVGHVPMEEIPERSVADALEFLLRS